MGTLSGWVAGDPSREGWGTAITFSSPARGGNRNTTRLLGGPISGNASIRMKPIAYARSSDPCRIPRGAGRFDTPARQNTPEPTVRISKWPGHKHPSPAPAGQASPRPDPAYTRSRQDDRDGTDPADRLHPASPDLRELDGTARSGRPGRRSAYRANPAVRVGAGP